MRERGREREMIPDPIVHGHIGPCTGPLLLALFFYFLFLPPGNHPGPAHFSNLRGPRFPAQSQIQISVNCVKIVVKPEALKFKYLELYKFESSETNCVGS
jgi:hypothetical protein